MHKFFLKLAVFTQCISQKQNYASRSGYHSAGHILHITYFMFHTPYRLSYQQGGWVTSWTTGTISVSVWSPII